MSTTIPTLASGAPATGSEVIDCRIIVRDTPSAAVRPAADGVWEVHVPEHPVPLTDLAELPEEPRLGDDGWRDAGSRLVRRLTDLVAVHPVKAKRHLVQVHVPASTTRRNLRNLAQGLVGAGHTPLAGAPEADLAGPAVRDIRIDLSAVSGDTASAADRELRLGAELGAAAALADALGAVPDGSMTLDWWRQQTRALFHGRPGVRVKVRTGDWLERKGLGGVRAASADPARTAGLVEITWDPAAADGELTDDRPDAVLVGGAVVPAVLSALSRLHSPQKVIGLVPVTGLPADLRPPLTGRPEEVVTHVGGRTTTLHVTGDETRRAETVARLATADALAYGVQRHRPRRIISAGPTSTGAKTALGTRTGALFTEDPVLARRLTLRGAKVGERWWPMPLPTDVAPQPDGPDLLNSALYLRGFTGDVTHIHLDTAGPAAATTPAGDTVSGVTGFPARTLVEWLRK
ncbi:aminopeptidase [Corynebacterium variabile]|uniref:aminopeptidase n=1 Tax=Corynebacterium variabile TaxID=1727 RepID=UPI003A8DC250